MRVAPPHEEEKRSSKGLEKKYMVGGLCAKLAWTFGTWREEILFVCGRVLFLFLLQKAADERYSVS